MNESVLSVEQAFRLTGARQFGINNSVAQSISDSFLFGDEIIIPIRPSQSIKNKDRNCDHKDKQVGLPEIKEKKKPKSRVEREANISKIKNYTETTLSM